MVYYLFILGMEYYTVHSSPSTLQQQFAITPAENDTEVTVQLSSTLEGKVWQVQLVDGPSLYTSL